MAAWSGEMTLRFIEMYKSRTVLWDPKNINHKNKYQRQEALMDISKQLGIDRYELERKIKNLTSHYFRERRKTDSLKKTRTHKAYESKWFAFKALDFLRGRNEPWYNMQQHSEITEVCDEELNRTKENGELYEMGELPIKCEVQTDDDTEMSIENEALIKPKLEYEQSSCKEIGSEGVTSSGYQQSSKSEQSTNETLNWNRNRIYDEFSLLGEEVAIKVRKLPTNYARCFVQYKIQRILFKAGLGKYNQAPNNRTGITSVEKSSDIVDNYNHSNNVSNQITASSTIEAEGNDDSTSHSSASTPTPLNIVNDNSNDINNDQEKLYDIF